MTSLERHGATQYLGVGNALAIKDGEYQDRARSCQLVMHRLNCSLGECLVPEWDAGTCTFGIDW
jgi:hypothetical protein